MSIIPAQAVEAAAKVHQDLVARGGYPTWDALPPYGRPWRLDYMRAALEAAAPFMLVEQWEES